MSIDPWITVHRITYPDGTAGVEIRDDGATILEGTLVENTGQYAVRWHRIRPGALGPAHHHAGSIDGFLDSIAAEYDGTVSQ